ncbi:MAG: Crp/Fnr family transcriptional regulator [Syntrophobacteraceae bacterium]|jgi:CRP/FNR family transcriptional regulator
MFEKVGGFSALPREHLIRLEAISREISVRKGSILFSPGDRSQGFYAVSKGAVRLYRVSSKGKEITLEIADAGSTFAEASIFSEIYHCYAEALSHSTVYLIRKAAFLEMIQGDILFALAWIRILSHEVIHHRQRIEELSLKSPRARIVSYLLLLAEMQNCASVTLPVHRKSIATLLGMTHETFYRTARELELEGLVRFDGQRLEIINRPLLEELVD